MTSAVWGLSIVAALCSVSFGAQYDPNTPNPYVTADDRQIATFAAQAVTKYCGAGGFVGEVKATRDDLSYEIGGENLIVNALRTFGNRKELRQQWDLFGIIQEEVLQPWVYLKVAPMFFAILTILVWLFCCWSACCRCCRCCTRDHKHSVKLKACQAIVVILCFAAAALATLATKAGFGRLENGFDNLLCSGAKLLNVSLDGEGGVNGFIGVVPVLDKFHEIGMQLDDGSPLMNELGIIINSTTGIEDALRLTTDSLKLLGQVLSYPSNIRPRDNTSNASMYHICLTCETLGPLVSGIATGVEEGVGTALFLARAEVSSQLEGGKRQDFQQTLEQAAGPMLKFKDQMAKGLKPLVDPDSNIDSKKEQITSLVYQSIFIVHFAALALICGGCCACACFAKSSYDPDGEDAPGYAPKNCSCVVWCCSFLFLFFVFLTSGILNLVLIPTSGLCVMLADLDATLIQDIAAGLDLDLSGDSGEMFEGMVDACWAGNVGSSDNLLDIIYTRDNSSASGNGSKTYLREKVVGMVKEPVDQAFSQINVSGGNITIGSNPAFAQLRAALSNASIMGTLVLEPPYYEFTNDTTYQNMGLEPDIQKAAFRTATQCDDYELAGVGRLNGIENFSSQMEAQFSAVDAGSNVCIKKVVLCTNPTDPQNQQACNAANNFLDLKKNLMDQQIFRCDLFEVGGTDCDPLNMIQAPNGTYLNDCLLRHADGYTYTDRKARDCNLAEFNQYVQEFGVRLAKSIDRLDNVTITTLDAISKDLKGLVDKYFVGEITQVANGVTCGFMPPIVKQVIDGMCFQGVDGLKITANMYQITALFIVLLAIDMYVLFRIVADNIAKFRENSK